MDKLISKFKEMFAKKKSYTTSNALNPHKHWILILRVFAVLVILLILFSFYMLYRIKNEEAFQVTPTIQESTTPLRDNLLKQVQDTFNKKADKEKDIKANPPVFKDPSI